MPCNAKFSIVPLATSSFVAAVNGAKPGSYTEVAVPFKDPTPNGES